MRTWILPGAAASFGAGIVAAGRASRPAAGAVLFGAGLVLAASGWLGGARRTEGSRRILRTAGLLGPQPEPGPRERVLLAAGFPVGERRSRDPPAPWRTVAVLAGMALLGAGWAALRHASTPKVGALQGRFVEFRGTALSDPRRFEFGWGAEARLEAVEGDGRTVPVSLRVWLNGVEPAAGLEAGVPLAGAGRIEGLGPEASGFEGFLVDRGVAATLSLSRVSVLGPPRSAALRLASAARAALRRGALAALDERRAGLLLGLAIGDTGRMDPEVDEDFRATGLGHLLAVSGSNVAMFLAPVLALAGLLRVPRTARVAVGFVAVGFFALLTRWEPSVLRASAMAVLALAALWAGRPRSTAGALAVAVLALLAADPGLAVSLGFQLSVAATAGLAAMAGSLSSRLRWLPRPVAVAAAATAAAQVAVTPLLLLRFGIVPTVTLLANILAFPAVGPALLLGVAASGVGAVAPWASKPLGDLAGLPLGYLIGMSDHMARFPLPSLAGGGAVPVLAAVVAGAMAWRLRRGRRPVGVAIAAATVAVLAWSSLPEAHSSSLTVVFLDVGQGDAALVRAPDGATVLVDAGPDQDEVATDLARLGVRRIDVAVASHAHADHVEGFPAVLARFPVSVFLEPACPADSPSYRRMLDAISDEEVEVRHPRGGAVFRAGSLRIEVLGPDECMGHDGPNDDSLVLRVVHRGWSVLFPGDAEVPAQEDLLEDGDPIAAHVLKVPHHGGDTSFVPFFEGVRAVVAVVSTGPNDYGHPVPSVLATLGGMGMEVLRTDLLGDVTVRLGPEGVLVESARR